MIREIVQDIQPAKRSLREVLPISPKNSSGNIKEKPQKVTPPKIKKEGNSRSFLWPIVVIALVFLILTVFDSLSKATVIITPHERKVLLENSDFVAGLGAGEVFFEFMEVSGSTSTSLLVEETKEVSTKASGKVIIYNNYSSSPQKLLTETRLLAPDGKIYKTSGPVTIPGYTKNGTKIVPGAVEVLIIADVAGPEYNKGLTDFTIFGFKGTPKYEKFYARSKTEISGGSSGLVGVISEEERLEIEKKLESELREKLLSQAKSEIPDTFVFYESMSSFDSETSSTVSKDTMESVFTKTGTLKAFIFDRSSLTKSIKESDAISLDVVEEVKIPNIESLSFLVKDISSIAKKETMGFGFEISGEANVVSVVPELLLKRELVGKKKKYTPVIFTKYPSIETARVVFRPFWKNTFPKEDNRIRFVYSDKE